MKRPNKKIITLFCILLALICLVSCNMCGTSYNNQYDSQNASATTKQNLLEWVHSQFASIEEAYENNILLKEAFANAAGVEFKNYSLEQFEIDKRALLETSESGAVYEGLLTEKTSNQLSKVNNEIISSITEDELNAKYEELLSAKTSKEQSRMSDEEKATLRDSAKDALRIEKYEAYINDRFLELSSGEKTTSLEAFKVKAIQVITDYPIYSVISGKTKEDKIEENYKVILIKKDIVSYTEYINNAISVNPAELNKLSDAVVANESTLQSCIGSKTTGIKNNYRAGIENETDIYRIITIFTFQVAERNLEAEPLIFYTGKEFWAHLFNNLLVFPVGCLLYFISKLFGGYYILGLIITTLIVRTLGWPIYAKTNDLSLKMKIIQPELNKIQAKYEGKSDPDSQRMMQMEQAQLYKKHKVFGWGCLMPILQFPIFMAVYRAIQRLPYTFSQTGTKYDLNWAANINPRIFGIDLFADKSVGTPQLIGIIILCLLVVATQFASQKISEYHQKKAQDKSQEDIPLYRRQAEQQTQNSTQSTMKLMIYFMMFMMASFVWQSKAGLGVYWLIGNMYSIFQMFINNKTSQKRMEKLAAKANKY